jgi:hypothetical protein
MVHAEEYHLDMDKQHNDIREKRLLASGRDVRIGVGVVLPSQVFNYDPLMQASS